MLMHKQPLWDADLQMMRVFNKLQEQKLVLYFNFQRLIFRLVSHTADQTTTAELALGGGHLDVAEMAPV